MDIDNLPKNSGIFSIVQFYHNGLYIVRYESKKTFDDILLKFAIDNELNPFYNHVDERFTLNEHIGDGFCEVNHFSKTLEFFEDMSSIKGIHRDAAEMYKKHRPEFSITYPDLSQHIKTVYQ